MKLFSKGNIYSSIKRNGEELTAVTSILNEELEIVTDLIIDAHTFEIREMLWHVYRCDVSSNTGNYCIKTGKGATDMLNGKEAYLTAHKLFDELLVLPGGELLKYIFIQSGKAIVQAETFLYKERGYDRKESYDEYWDIVEENGCSFYTYPCDDDLRWSEYVGNYDRGDYLFQRFKTFAMMEHDFEQTYFGTFSDSYHHIDVEMTVNTETKIITAFNLRYIKAPGKACLRSINNGKNMVGVNIRDVDKKTVVSKIGGCEGCYHVLDLSWDIIKKIKLEDKA